MKHSTVLSDNYGETIGSPEGMLWLLKYAAVYQDSSGAEEG